MSTYYDMVGAIDWKSGRLWEDNLSRDLKGEESQLGRVKNTEMGKEKKKAGEEARA